MQPISTRTRNCTNAYTQLALLSQQPEDTDRPDSFDYSTVSYPEYLDTVIFNNKESRQDSTKQNKTNGSVDSNTPLRPSYRNAS
jgi:hypothetical protein